jgi:hypothetical protein
VGVDRCGLELLVATDLLREVIGPLEELPPSS